LISLLTAAHLVQQEQEATQRVRQDRAMLVNFDASWCGYCRKMDRETWKHPTVVARLGEMVAVRGTPTILLVDGDGQVAARAGGFMDSRQFLEWLEEGLAGVGAARPVDSTIRVSGP